MRFTAASVLAAAAAATAGQDMYGETAGTNCVDVPDANLYTANTFPSCAAAREAGACDNVRCLLLVEMYLALLASTQYSH